MKALLLSILGMATLAGSSTLVSAQQWDQWDEPRRPAQAAPGYGDSYGDQQDDDDRYFNQQDGPRADNRYSDPDNDPRRYDPRYNGDRDATPSRPAQQPYPGRPVYGNDSYANDRYGSSRYGSDPYARSAYGGERYSPDPDPRNAYGNEPNSGSGYGRDDYGAWDAAPSREDEERLSKSQGATGGSRPYIAPVAPPKVAFSGPYAPGSVVIDTSARKLYYVLNTTTAYAYSIGVGRQGFAWTGKEKVSRIADWPDWYPPAEMRQRQPGLPERMLGGIRNPLGAKAIYLGNTLYRIHGTNEPKSIGTAASSGCFRMMNENVLHLATLVHVGTEVTIVRSLSGRVASATKIPARTARVPERSAPPLSTPPRIINRSARSEDDQWDPYNGWH